jgi:hypothetical protein
MEHKKQQIIQAVISKAWEDSDFIIELMTNPIVAIEKLTGVKVGMIEGKELVFVDQTDKTKVYVNIPAEPEMENMELTEHQLEAIAGGGMSIWNEFVNNLFPTLRDSLII